ncbi:MAG: hypothetical protein ACFB2Z_12130 [Maricaulaceae bacterium]
MIRGVVAIGVLVVANFATAHADTIERPLTAEELQVARAQGRTDPPVVLQFETWSDVAAYAQGKAVLFGEVHGYTEPAGRAKALMTAAALRGQSYALGIEISGRHQAAISDYLDSDGRYAARDAFMHAASDFWGGKTSGRSTCAWFDLIELARQHRRAGIDADVLAVLHNRESFPLPYDGVDNPYWDELAGLHLRHLLDHNQVDLVIGLMGGLHTMLNTNIDRNGRSYYEVGGTIGADRTLVLVNYQASRPRFGASRTPSFSEDCDAACRRFCDYGRFVAVAGVGSDLGAADFANRRNNGILCPAPGVHSDNAWSVAREWQRKALNLPPQPDNGEICGLAPMAEYPPPAIQEALSASGPP